MADPLDDTDRLRFSLARHVLLVEDEVDLASTVEEYLSGEGYQVVIAEDGLQALEHLRAGNRPGLIITDLMMPRMSGADLVKRMAQEEELRSIPVVMVSAVPQYARAAGLAPDRVLVKPVELEDLMGFVTRYCERSGATALASAIG